MSQSRDSRAFTLVEFLAVISIIAVLISGAIYFTASYIQWAKASTDKEVYTILNDALSRYKCEGGGTVGLSFNSTISRILTAMQSPPTQFAGMPTAVLQSHFFLSPAVTYRGKSLGETGTGAQYHFSRYDIYYDGSGDASGNLGGGINTLPYGLGNGYIAVNGSYMNFGVTTTSGYWAAYQNGGNKVTFSSGQWSGALSGHSTTFYACDSSGNPTGSITTIDTDNVDDGPTPYTADITALNVKGLQGLTSLNVGMCTSQLTTLDVSGLTNLTSLSFGAGMPPLTSLNCSGCSSLQTLDIGDAGIVTLTSLNLSGCNNLQQLNIEGSPVGTVNVSGFRHLTMLEVSGCNLSSINASSCPALNFLDAGGEQTGCAINILGDHGIGYFADDAGAVVTGP